jgi:hypothetical protein
VYSRLLLSQLEQQPSNQESGQRDSAIIDRLLEVEAEKSELFVANSVAQRQIAKLTATLSQQTAGESWTWMPPTPTPDTTFLGPDMHSSRMLLQDVESLRANNDALARERDELLQEKSEWHAQLQIGNDALDRALHQAQASKDALIQVGTAWCQISIFNAVPSGNENSR